MVCTDCPNNAIIQRCLQCKGNAFDTLVSEKMGSNCFGALYDVNGNDSDLNIKIRKQFIIDSICVGETGAS